MTAVKLQDVAAANALLVSLGGEDQLPAIAAKSFDRAMQLQERIDRALRYAEQTPPNSVHARQMARILDGSITVDDELAEVPELDRPVPRQKAVESRPRRKTVPKGSADRTTAERLKIREWLADKGIDTGRGRIPQRHLDEYDQAMADERRQRREQRADDMAGAMAGQLI
jgi:hypothetical protein